MPTREVCKIVEAIRLNEYAWSFTLEAPSIAAAISAPDQFVHVKCGEGLFLRRPISICDWGDGLVRVVFEVRGEGTQWLSRRKEGDELDVMGPLGNGFPIERERRVLVVGGGIGVPPMLGCAKWSGRADAVVGFRSADRAMLLEDFEAACGRVYVCSDDGTLGEHGFADGQVRKALTEHKDYTAVLACGPKGMLGAVWAVCREFDVPCLVSMEERMACGVGACLGCAIPMADGEMKHVCKDGPVFAATEVDWNG